MNMDKGESTKPRGGVYLVKQKLEALLNVLKNLDDQDKEEAFALIDNALRSLVHTKVSPKTLELYDNSFLPKTCLCSDKDFSKKPSDKTDHSFNCPSAIDATSGQEPLSCSQITIPDNFFNLPETAYKVSDFPENLHYEGLEKELEKLESYTPYLDLSQKNGDSRTTSFLASFEKTKSSYKEDEVAILDLCSRENTSQFKTQWRNLDEQEFSTEEVSSIQMTSKNAEIAPAARTENIEISIDVNSKQLASEYTCHRELRNYSEKQASEHLKKYSPSTRNSESILVLEKMFSKDLESRPDPSEKLKYMTPSRNENISDISLPTDKNMCQVEPLITSVNKRNIEAHNQEALNLVNRKEGPESNFSNATEIAADVDVQTDSMNKSQRTSELKVQAPLSCIACKNVIDDVSLFNDHQITCTKSFTCIYCNVKYPNKVSFVKHISAHKRNTCPHCGMSFTLFKELKRHIKSVHNVQLAGKTYPCTFCKRIFLKKCSLFYHYRTHAQGEQEVCLRCGKFLPNRALFEDHMKDHIEKSLKCNICNQIFVRAQQLQSHIKTHEKYKCEHCEKAFANKVFLHKHSLVEHGLKPKHVKINSAKYVCDECGKSFHRPSLLNIHLKIHLGEKPLECRICNKTYDNPRGLMKHLKSLKHEYKSLTNELSKSSEALSTATALFACEYCELSMPSVRLLEMHCAMSHNRGITQTCNHCDFKTNKKSLYKKHLETHRERKFICEVCGKAFMNYATLKDHHAFVHSDERNFKCDTCMKSFKNKSTLVRHMKTHLLERPHKCACGAAFKELFHLRRHKLSTHVDTSPRKKKKTADKSKRNPKDIKESAKYCIVEPNNDHSENDFVVTPCAVVMAGETSLNNEPAHFAVLDSQIIQFVPSSVPATQEALHTVSLVSGELHTLSIPSYPVPQPSEESFISENMDVLAPHSYQQVAIAPDINQQSKTKKTAAPETSDITFSQGSTEGIATYSYTENEDQSSTNNDFLAAAIRQQTINQDFEILSSNSFFC